MAEVIPTPEGPVPLVAYTPGQRASIFVPDSTTDTSRNPIAVMGSCELDDAIDITPERADVCMQGPTKQHFHSHSEPVRPPDDVTETDHDAASTG